MGIDALFLAVMAFVAGLVDAVVGGGGLIQIPALFAVYPQAAPATLFGSNKFASIFGTGSAAWRYARRIAVPWRWALPAAAAALPASYLGAMAVSLLPHAVLRPLVLVLLIAVVLYTYAHKSFGSVDAPRPPGRAQTALAMACGAALGFYDGFFGPGAGSFLIFVFVRLFGLSFLRASSAAKVVNVATNFSALAYFAAHGQVLWPLAMLMAVCNIAGAQYGSQLALRHGSALVRRMFLLVATAFIAKFGYDTWLSSFPGLLN